MNTKILTLGILFTLAVYAMNSVIAANTSENQPLNLVDTIDHCEVPLNDGFGYENGGYVDKQPEFQRGDMNASKAQLRNHLKDGSGGITGNE